MLIGQTLIVDVYLIGLGHGLGLSDNLLEVIKGLQFQVIELHQLIVVQALVLKTIAHDTLYIYLLQLFEHTGYIESSHFASLDRYDGAEVQEFTHHLTIIAAGLTRFR